MKSFITSLDILSYHPTVYFNGRTYYQTIVGGIITIITFLAILAFSIVFLLEFIHKSNKTVIFTREANFDHTIKMDKLIFGFTLFSGTSSFVPESILSITGLRATVESTLVGFSQMSFHQCTDDDIPKLNYENLDADYLKNFKCMNNTGYNIGDGRITYFNLYVHKCNNETYNNKCKTMEEIDDYINKNNIYMILNYQYVAVDHSNINNPISIYNTIKDLKIPYGFTLSARIYFRKTFYEKDDNFLFRHKIIDEGISLDVANTEYLYSNQITNALIPNIISVFRFYAAEDYAEKYIRSYEKIGVVFSNIGGIFNLLFYFTSFITGLLTKGFYFNDLILFTLSDKEYNLNNINDAPLNNKHDNSSSNILYNIKPLANCKQKDSLIKSIYNNHNLNQKGFPLKNRTTINNNYFNNRFLNPQNLKVFNNSKFELNNIPVIYKLFYACFIFKSKKFKNVSLFHSFVKKIQKKLSCNNIIMDLNLIYQIYPKMIPKSLINNSS